MLFDSGKESNNNCMIPIVSTSVYNSIVKSYASKGNNLRSIS